MLRWPGGHSGTLHATDLVRGDLEGVPPVVSPLLKVTVDLSGSLVQGVSPQIVCPWSSDATLVVIECVVASVSLRLSGL